MQKQPEKAPVSPAKKYEGLARNLNLDDPVFEFISRMALVHPQTTKRSPILSTRRKLMDQLVAVSTFQKQKQHQTFSSLSHQSQPVTGARKRVQQSALTQHQHGPFMAKHSSETQTTFSEV